tara:strand:- start:101 stop:337 length:237 start_codon:yes stop_codon:yes gene_type:complete
MCAALLLLALSLVCFYSVQKWEKVVTSGFKWKIGGGWWLEVLILPLTAPDQRSNEFASGVFIEFRHRTSTSTQGSAAG